MGLADDTQCEHFDDMGDNALNEEGFPKTERERERDREREREYAGVGIGFAPAFGVPNLPDPTNRIHFYLPN